MKNVYTVGQINSYIKNMFVTDFVLNRVYVKGEASNVKYHPSGHIYFSLKDETGTISCVMFAGQRKGLAFSMRDGQQLVVLGSVNVYERDGRYQIYAKEIILDGAGLLHEQFERRKAELAEMGMFAEEYKQPIPRYIRTLGIVTAPAGAAIRDIQNIASRRNPYVQLILYPALVQGQGATESIVKGIETLDAMGLDVLIVGRGGGSIEDLWAFNEESVARAIFECRTPVISAVGHETDVTIADFVADLRAPTPSAAAELAVADIRQIMEQLRLYRRTLNRDFYEKLRGFRAETEQYRYRFRLASPKQRLLEQRTRAAELSRLLTAAMEDKLAGRRKAFELYIERLNGLSPLLKLNQGYSYTMNGAGQAVTDVRQVQKGEQLTIQVANGRITARVEEVCEQKPGTGNEKQRSQKDRLD